MKIVPEIRKPLRSIKGFENGIDYKRFSQEMPYMFADEPKRIEFFAEEWVIDQVVDWFGKDITIEPLAEGGCKVSVDASVNAMEYWAMQYLNAVEILSPKDLRERVKSNIENALKKYQN